MNGGVKVRCPGCKTKLRLKGANVFGKKIRCPQCSQMFRVPAPSTPPAEELAPSADAPIRPKPAQPKLAQPKPAQPNLSRAKPSQPKPVQPKKPVSRPVGTQDEDEFWDYIDAAEPGDHLSAIATPGGEDLPLSDYQRRQLEKKQAAHPPARRKKRKRSSAGAHSAVMGYFLSIIAACTGGLIGAMLWAGVVYATGYEIGYMAWLVGAIVGVSVLMTRPDEGLGPGLIAASVSLLAILGGKFAAVVLLANYYTDELIHRDTTKEEVMIAYVADQVVEEWIAENRELQWPQVNQNIGNDEAALDQLDDDEDDSELFGLHASKEDYPVGVWEEAEKRWKSKSAAEQEELRKKIAAEDQERDEMAAGAKGFLVGLLFIFSFGFFDLLWFGLAIGTAYKVALGFDTD